jgi:tRNA G18 (ribose-2'-O)-methylase SpoU
LKFRKLEMQEMGRLPASESKSAQKFPLVFILDNLRSLSNVGSLFRTADSLGLSAIYLCGFTGQPPNREIEKTALGATDSVSWQHFPDIRDCISDLKNQGFRIVALEQTTSSTLLHQFRSDGPLAVILGNEISGVSEEALELVDEVVEIPQFGMKHSLNVSVSAGILAWHILQGRISGQNSQSTS